LQSLKNSLHFIVETASGDHPFDPYLSLLKVGGVMTIVCFPGEIKIKCTLQASIVVVLCPDTCVVKIYKCGNKSKII